MRLKFYRHKTYKNLFLKKGNEFYGDENTQFYDVTLDVLEAIKSLAAYGFNFMEWYVKFPNNKTKVILTKEVDIDGYKGTLTKELELSISDFELVELSEVTENG